MSNIMESHKIMMFLMGSNEEFVSSKHHILLMEPLHAVSMAFSLLLKVEKQSYTVNSSRYPGFDCFISEDS